MIPIVFGMCERECSAPWLCVCKCVCAHTNNVSNEFNSNHTKWFVAVCTVRKFVYWMYFRCRRKKGDSMHTEQHNKIDEFGYIRITIFVSKNPNGKMHTMRTHRQTLDAMMVLWIFFSLRPMRLCTICRLEHSVRFLLIGNHHFLRQSIFLEHFSWHNDDVLCSVRWRKKTAKEWTRISERENDDDSDETVVIFFDFDVPSAQCMFFMFLLCSLATTIESQKKEKNQPLEFRHFRFLSVREYARVRMSERLRDLYRKASQSIKPTTNNNNNGGKKQH